MLWTLLVVLSPFLCPDCPRAQALLVEGDTAEAAVLLEQQIQRDSSAKALGELGFLLASIASAKAEDRQRRWRAEALLRRAIDKDPGNGRWYLGLGLALLKQGVVTDARRMLVRALDGERAETLVSSERALALLQQARMAELHVLDFRGLIPNGGRLVETSYRCREIFCENFDRPALFHDRLLSIETVDELVADDKEVIEALYREAFELAPESDRVARGLLGLLARDQRWEEFHEHASRHLEEAPENGWAHFYVGTSLTRSGAYRDAGMAFREGLRYLPEGERAQIQGSLSSILKEEAAERFESAAHASEMARHLWQLYDPLLLTEANERWAEHLARVTLAEIWFSDRDRGVEGYLTEPGTILLRYGPPKWVRRVVRGEGEARSAAAMYAGKTLSDLLDDNLTPMTDVAPFGGRWILWTYERSVPSFVFEQMLSTRTIRHAGLSRSMQHAQNVRAEAASTFSSFEVADLPHQIARFLGDNGGVSMDVYARVPAGPPDAVPIRGKAGLVLLPRRRSEGPSPLATDLWIGARPSVVTFRSAMEPGVYPYSVEVVSPGEEVRAARRGAIEIDPFSEGALALSDLVLAHVVEVRRRPVRGRKDLRIEASPNLSFEPGEPVSLYLEAYNLKVGGWGERRYRVELQVKEEDRDNIVTQIVSVLGGLFGERGPERGLTRWEATAPDENRVPIWVSVALPNAGPGSYEAVVRITDLADNTVATAEREFRIASEPEKEQKP